MTTPLHFGPPAGRLFGVYQAPAGVAARPLGIVLCYPIGQEYLRAHRSFRQLAIRLARHGFHVLRFDYHGCGDSSGPGEVWTVPEALGDIGRAAHELRRRAGCSRIGLVGLRFGATLALLAAGQVDDAAALVLWEPVLSGGAYLQSLEAQQAAWHRLMGLTIPPDGGEPATELMGFPLPAAARARVEEIDLLAVDRCPAERVLLLMEEAAGVDGRRLEERLARLGARVDRRHDSGPPVWLRQDGMDRAVVASAAVEGIVAWCGALT